MMLKYINRPPYSGSQYCVVTVCIRKEYGDPNTNACHQPEWCPFGRFIYKMNKKYIYLPNRSLSYFNWRCRIILYLNYSKAFMHNMSDGLHSYCTLMSITFESVKENKILNSTLWLEIPLDSRRYNS